MTWARIDDGFPEHPKVVGLSDSAFRVHVRAICYCARNLTNGEVTGGALRGLGASKRVCAELQEALLWEPIAGGYLIHDYLVYNPTKEKVLAERVAAKARMDRVRGSPDVRPNKPRTSPDVRPKFGDPVHHHLPRPRPDPHPPSSESEDSSSSDDAMPTDVRERRDTILSRLPTQYQRDPLTWDEAEQLARDCRDPAVLAQAISDCRRTKGANGRAELPFPSNLRKYLPPEHGGFELRDLDDPGLVTSAEGVVT